MKRTTCKLCKKVFWGVTHPKKTSKVIQEICSRECRTVMRFKVNCKTCNREFLVNYNVIKQKVRSLTLKGHMCSVCVKRLKQSRQQFIGKNRDVQFRPIVLGDIIA